MEEKIIIETGKLDIHKAVKIINYMGLIIAAILGIWGIYAYNNALQIYEEDYDFLARFGTASDYAMMESGVLFLIVIGVVALFAIVSYIVYLCFEKTSLTVTNKRVYGYGFWGKRVDLPIDSISAVAMKTLFFKGVHVSTSSGSITFLIAKAEKIFEEISNLLMDRQNSSKGMHTEGGAYISNASSADELEKYKGLLDKGVITQEEFEAKKKQLLGL